MRVLELPDALRRYEVEPVLVAGWETRGNEYPTRPLGALRHWTAGALRVGIPSLQILTFGRSDLPGPLCAVGQERAPADRDDRAYVVASGKANHAGAGLLNGIVGNYRLLGLEIEWAPQLGEGFSARRRDVSERIMAALADCCADPEWGDVGEHREYALPAGRKIDTNLDGDALRDRVQALLHPAPPVPAPTEEDEAMFLAKLSGTPEVYLFEAGRMTHITSRQDVTDLATALGLPATEANLEPATWANLVAGRTVHKA